MRLLHVDASIAGLASRSRQLSAAALGELRRVPWATVARYAADQDARARPAPGPSEKTRMLEHQNTIEVGRSPRLPATCP